MAAIIKIQVETSGGLEEVKKDVRDLGATAEKSGGGFNALQEIGIGALRAIGAAAVDLAAKGLMALAGAVQDGIADAQKNAQIQAQTAAVLEDTGDTAGRTAEQIAEYASALSDAAGASLFGDDQIQESTNLLLTFTNIKDATLDAATAISVDMAQALGGAPKDAAIQLGKALNSPTAGITALSRVGVSFSAEQKATIKTLEEMGDMAGAQAIILEELNKEFGGSAVAAANATGGWSEFNGRMGEAKEALGAAVLPLLTQLAGVLITDVLPIVESAAAAFGDLVNYFTAVAEDGDTLNDFLGNLPGFLQPIVQTVAEMGASFQTFIAGLMPALQSVGSFLQTQIMPILSDLATALFPLVGAAIQILAGFWTDVLLPSVLMLWSVLTTVVLPVIASLAGWLRDNLPGAIQAVADFLTGTLFPALHTVYDFISVNVIPILAQVAEWLITNVPVAIQMASDFFNTVLVPALIAVWDFIQVNVLPIFATVANWLSTTIPAATTTTSSFWTGTLLPALNSVWAFIQNFVVPLFTALVQVHMAVMGLAVRTLTGIWMTILLPALTAIWTFLSTLLIPIFDWLNLRVLQPLFQTLKDMTFFVLGGMIPFMQMLAQTISGVVTSAFSHLMNIAGDVRGGLKSIGDAVQGVIEWLNDLASAINSISIPDWLEGHSPPPMANWFSDISSAVAGVNAQLPTLAMNLAAQVGPSGQTITNTASSRSFTYAPTISTTGNVDGPMDLALASSLAGV